MDDSKIIMLPENQKSFDPSVLLALNNGGFGDMNAMMGNNGENNNQDSSH